MAGSRDFEESAGLLANDDLYDADSDSGIRPTPEERESPARPRPSKVVLPQRNPAGQNSRAINVLTILSLCLSGLSFLALIIALIIIPTGNFEGPPRWRSTGVHRTTGEAVIGLAISSITTFFCFVSALRNVKKPMPVALSAFLDLMLVSIFFPMAIYAVTIGYPTQNWCPAYNGCLDTVLAVKILVIMGAVLGFLLSFIHFALLVLRPWKRPSSIEFSIFQFDVNVTVTKRVRHHTCNCCAQLAATRRVAGAGRATSVPAHHVGEGRILEI